MNLKNHLRKPAEQVFAALIEDCQAAWELANDTARKAMRATEPPPKAKSPVPTADRARPARTCPHCRGDHPARLCPKAARDRQETIKVLEMEEAMNEVDIEDLRHLRENTVKTLREAPENEAALCWECGEAGHYKRDCVSFLKRMSIFAGRMRNRGNNYGNNNQRYGRQFKPASPRRKSSPGRVSPSVVDQIKQSVVSSIPQIVEQTLIQISEQSAKQQARMEGQASQGHPLPSKN